jgi:hypothetical protein
MTIAVGDKVLVNGDEGTVLVVGNQLVVQFACGNLVVDVEQVTPVAAPVAIAESSSSTK